MTLDNAQVFRGEAIARGLVLDTFWIENAVRANEATNKWGVTQFTFDLNQGPITLVNATPKRVVQLIQTAFECGGYFSEAFAILELRVSPEVFERGELKVYWSRTPVTGWTTLAQWLEQHGHTTEQVLPAIAGFLKE